MIVVQLLSIAFAGLLAFNQLPAINKITIYGPAAHDQTDLHFVGWFLKLVFAIAIAGWYTAFGDILKAFFLSASWMYLVFDPVINHFRDNKQPLFTLDGSYVNAFVTKYFGKSAGIWKALILVAVIVILNLF